MAVDGESRSRFYLQTSRPLRVPPALYAALMNFSQHPVEGTDRESHTF